MLKKIVRILILAVIISTTTAVTASFAGLDKEGLTQAATRSVLKINSMM